MGRDETMVHNGRVVAYMVAAPQHDVVAYRHEWLYHVVLEDEAVFSESDIAPHERMWAHVRRRFVTFIFRRLIQSRP